METTAHWAIPKPDADRSDSPDGPTQIGDLADFLDGNANGRVAMVQQGVLAARPVSTVGNPGKRDRRYLVVGDPDPAQNGIEYVDTGTSWITLASTIPPASIDTAELADNAVTQPKMADNSVGSAEIIDDSVGSAELAPGAVTATEVANALKPSAGAGAGTEALRKLGTAAGEALAGTAAPAGTIVGTSDAQTLTNKTLQNVMLEGRRSAASQKNANYTIVANDEVIPVDAAGGARTITLPPFATYPGKVVTIKKIDASANAVIVDGDAAETIEGVASISLRSQYESITIMAGLQGGWGVINWIGRRPVGAFSAYRAAAVSPVNGTEIVWDAEDYDLEGWHNVANGRYTPQQAGYYKFAARLQATAGTIADQQWWTIYLAKNGAVIKYPGSGVVEQSGVAAGAVSGGPFPLVFANGTTDYFSIFVIHNKGAGAAVQVGSEFSWFSGRYIGPTA